MPGAHRVCAIACGLHHTVLLTDHGNHPRQKQSISIRVGLEKAVLFSSTCGTYVASCA